nr:class I SAM-dependent methyltransferase [Frankia sp. QA3]
MNLLHRKLCASERWATAVEKKFLPWALADVSLGNNVLELGPGFGATTRVLANLTPSLTALEIDEESARLLERRLGSRVRILHGDATRIPAEDGSFDTVVAFTMLHHVPSPAKQDQLFAEAFRVLRPGGTFAGSDSLTSFGFRLIHLGDTSITVDPDGLAARLAAAGFDGTRIETGASSFRFQGTRPVVDPAAAPSR